MTKARYNAIYHHFWAMHHALYTIHVANLPPPPPEKEGDAPNPLKWRLISDGFCLLRVPADDLVFDSRRMFPVLPEDDQGLVYRGGHDEYPKASKGPLELWRENEAIVDKNKWTMTPWVRVTHEYNTRGGIQARLFRGPGGECKSIDVKYLRLVGEVYERQQHNWSGLALCDLPMERDKVERSALLVSDHDGLLMIVMPVHTDWKTLQLPPSELWKAPGGKETALVGV